MPRSERVISKTDIYHVVLRGIKGQLILKEAEDHSNAI